MAAGTWQLTRLRAKREEMSQGVSCAGFTFPAYKKYRQAPGLGLSGLRGMASSYSPLISNYIIALDLSFLSSHIQGLHETVVFESSRHGIPGVHSSSEQRPARNQAELLES